MKVKSFAAEIARRLFALLSSLSPKVPLHFIYRDLPFLIGFPMAAEHCNATAIQPLKTCVLLLSSPDFECLTNSVAQKCWQQAQIHGVSLSLYHTHSCLMASVFHLLNKILHSQWFRIRGVLQGEANKNDYWTKIPSIHLSSTVSAPCRTQCCQ